MTQKLIGTNKIKMYLFARWITSCYSQDEINEQPGIWWKEQLNWFEKQIMPQYRKNGTLDNCKLFLSNRITLKTFENLPNMKLK